MTEIFHRTQLAQDIARQLLKPSVLDLELRSGLFMFGPHRTGKTTFLIHDLVPALEEGGALVVYLNLSGALRDSSIEMVQGAIREALLSTKSEAPRSALAVGLENLGLVGETTLSEALQALVDRAMIDIVLIVDEVQEAVSTLEGQRLLLALKAARDAINTRSVTPGYFLFIGACSSRTACIEMTRGNSQAFLGAVCMNYPLLERDYVEFLLARLHKEGHHSLPTIAVAEQLFRTLKHKPEELAHALLI